MKVKVQSVRVVPPEWYDERERFEKRSNRMFDEINKFVTETRGDIEKMQGESKALSMKTEFLQTAVELRLDATDEKLDKIATSLDTLSKDVGVFIKAHTEQHENEKGILKKIFGR